MLDWLKCMFFYRPHRELYKPPEAHEAEAHLEASRSALQDAIRAAEQNIIKERALAIADVARARRVIRLTDESVRLVREAGRR